MSQKETDTGKPTQRGRGMVLFVIVPVDIPGHEVSPHEVGWMKQRGPPLDGNLLLLSLDLALFFLHLIFIALSFSFLLACPWCGVQPYLK